MNLIIFNQQEFRILNFSKIYQKYKIINVEVCLGPSSKAAFKTKHTKISTEATS
jgi:hypothetical protein